MKIKSFADTQFKATIELDDGRKITLCELIQSRTYAGLLVGIPRDSMIDSLLKDALARSTRLLGELPAPYLLEPKIVDFEMDLVPMRVGKNLKVLPHDGEIQRVQGKRLPLTMCLARFSSPEVIDPTQDGRIFDESIATLVWFQEEFGPPSAPDVLRQIQSVPWSQIACDVSQ